MDKNQHQTAREKLAIEGIPERRFLLSELKKLIPSKDVLKIVLIAVLFILSFYYLPSYLQKHDLLNTFLLIVPIIASLFGYCIGLEKRISALESKINQNSSQNET